MIISRYVVQSYYFVRLGYIHIRVNFCVIDNLALPILSRTSYIDHIDQLVMAKFCIGRIIVPIQSGPSAVMLAYAPTVKTISTVDIA